jgi:hypothetical protein
MLGIVMLSVVLLKVKIDMLFNKMPSVVYAECYVLLSC